MNTLVTAILMIGFITPAHVVDPKPASVPLEIDPRFKPPPPATRIVPKIVMGTGAGMMIAGIAGMLFGGGCRTKDADYRCVDPVGGSTLYPALFVLGLGTAITGNYWYRRTEQPGQRPYEMNR